MKTLENKTALVTGASRGIGRATAAALARVGAHVLVHYGRSVAESLVDEIRSKEGRADAIRADLGTREGATLLAKEVRSLPATDLMGNPMLMHGAVRARTFVGIDFLGPVSRMSFCLVNGHI
jgi:NAD(P)-dependent dehydrogenase (short-subunit alcohol dehydrogenase family)